MYPQSVPSLISKNVGNALTNYKTWGGIMINVKDFGAKGDGVHDDTAAIQAAVNAAASSTNIKTVYFPTGLYLVTGMIDVSAHKITLLADNAQTYILFMPPTSRDCFYASGSYVNNLKIDGLNFLEGTSGALTTGAFIHLIDATQCTIQNCSFLNGNIGVWAERGNTLSVHRNHFQGQKTGIRTESQDPNNMIVDVSITQNYTTDCNIGLVGLEYSEGFFIRGNTFYLNSTNIQLIASAFSRLFSVKIQENDIDSGKNKGLEMTYVTNFQVTDNWCSNSVLYSMLFDMCGSGVIVGNLIYPKVTAGQSNFGIYLMGCNLITVNGNTFGGGDGAVRIDKTNLIANTACKGINVTGNTIAQCPTGIHLYNDTPVSDGVNVIANIFQAVTTPVGDAGTTHLVNVNNNSFT